ncbi:SUMO-interacting motif-containing protein 1 isoform X2 [Scleropages formosus]|nr:SUMO-interacting motif-containing protein 1 isoform X2 [Scleropages formosus]XP_018611811.1 SUMO-interacting motif-containing protein 1 isoform X2 [Scleropages formosus]XP_018611812.1 SUMO-interacting motif-containing protein 1 isoform X2 [Scleropages formosus]
MSSQSPKQGLAFPGVERLTGYTFTLPNNPQFPCQSSGNPLRKKDRTAPELLSANDRFPGKTWITKTTDGCENDVRWRHLWMPHDLCGSSYIEPSNIISSQSLHSQFPSDMHDKYGFTTDSLNSTVNASYITGQPPSPHMSSLPQQGSSVEVGLKKGGKVESVAEHIPLELERKNCEESGGNSFQNDAVALSPVSSYGSYYCPSEIDPVDVHNYSTCEALLDSISTDTYSSSPIGSGQSQGSLLVGSLAQTSGSYESKAGGTAETPSQFPSVTQLNASSDSQTLVDTRIGLGFGLAPSPSMPHATRPSSPTSTDILAGDSPDWVADDAELPSDSSLSDNKPSPINDPCMLTFGDISKVQLDRDASPNRHVPSFIQNAGEEMEKEVGEESDHESGLDCTSQDRCYVSKAHFRKLKPLSRRLPQDQTLVEVEDEDKEEDFGPREQLCRQSLSLVNSTIEENYPEGTLQLLSDFLHPRFYPPSEVMNHLIRGILLDTQCPITLVTEAYNLLMRIQKYHPANQSTFQWDWELLTSVMGTQDNSRKHRSSVQCMLLQYILQTLEDDFWANLYMLQPSIVRAVLSCDGKFSNVRDVIGWLICAVKNSTVDPAAAEAETAEEKMDRDENLQIVFLLQKVLTLVVEADRFPTLSCNKLSRELFQTLVSTVPLRQHRMLLLETIENKLLRCKILELLLEHTCQQKTKLPMSLSLILHFVRYSQPMDGAETQQKWSDLIQLLWMLLLSYEEVKEGHLRLSISDRFRSNRIPIQTLHDEITREVVQEVADAFLSRASADLGSSLPPQLQQSFSYLKDNLLEACQH